MKTHHRMLAFFIVSGIWLNSLGQDLPIPSMEKPAYQPLGSRTTPEIIGLPEASISRLDSGWRLKVPGAKLYIFTLDKKPELKLVLTPNNNLLRPDQLDSLSSLALDEGDPIPADFIVFPYYRGKTIRLYNCVTSLQDNRIYCDIVGLPTIPLPLRQRMRTGCGWWSPANCYQHE